MSCSNVLLPEPEGPTIATISPSSIRRSTPRRASTPPVIRLGQVAQLDDGHSDTTTSSPSAMSPLISTTPSPEAPSSTPTSWVPEPVTFSTA